MKSDLVLDDLDPTVSPSVAIAEMLRRLIASGRLKPGSPLPSQVALTERYGVARETVRAALRLLDEERLIDRRGQGARVVVRSMEDTSPTLAELRGELTGLQQSLQRGRAELAAAERHVSTALSQLSAYNPDDS